jgi:hypothetical protein
MMCVNDSLPPPATVSASLRRLRSASSMFTEIVRKVVAVGMDLADDVADDARRLLRAGRRVETELPHREEQPAVHRLQTVANIRKRAADDNRHGIIEIRIPHLLFNTDRQYPFALHRFIPCNN